MCCEASGLLPDQLYAYGLAHPRQGGGGLAACVAWAEQHNRQVLGRTVDTMLWNEASNGFVAPRTRTRLQQMASDSRVFGIPIVVARIDMLARNSAALTRMLGGYPVPVVLTLDGWLIQPREDTGWAHLQQIQTWAAARSLGLKVAGSR